nr:MAG TPA: hypothetical protein [Caudoviricetes sp.]
MPYTFIKWKYGTNADCPWSGNNHNTEGWLYDNPISRRVYFPSRSERKDTLCSICYIYNLSNPRR